ncbi:hypothetical protein OnM2_054070 [Erysiphe neolycopersici]|uniref:Uncharacterized protein n=1 Tax=Erysiphe neolycopersici TaxID=212602 RepID=A0A420HRL7_9PEZI|nr:hypothetical protein OnM2_054070 [Erysiphe neolycopersici]
MILPSRSTNFYLCTCFVLVVVTLIYRNSSHFEASRQLYYELYEPKLPKLSVPYILKPFRQSTIRRPPPVQKNSTNGEVSWYSNWNWLSPFSSSITLDENRSLLPPRFDRPPIYTYYDHANSKKPTGDIFVAETDLIEAENAILLTWRRAWWAKGFRPIILGPTEAMNNELSVELQMKDINASLKPQLNRWLAWEGMGTGRLCDYLLLPMADYEDPILVYLRRGEYPRLTRFEGLGNGLFAGSKLEITTALKKAISSEDLNIASNIINILPSEILFIEPKQTALAYYDAKTISEKYPRIAQEINTQDVKGLKVLNDLIIAHLHSVWQNNFHKGIAVVKPLPAHMTALIEPALTIAKFLSKCPDSPLPSSCPPNFPHCKPCIASQPLNIFTPSAYINTTSLFTIGTVPHPYTNAILAMNGNDIDISWIRRKSERDPWITALTKDILGTGMNGSPRSIVFKEIVGSNEGISRSLWLTAEYPIPEDLEWHFGFTIPTNITSDGKSETPVPGPERRPKKQDDSQNGPQVTESELVIERLALEKARNLGKEKIIDKESNIRNAIEAWNMADMEAWRFTRAFLARINVDRLEWEREETKYANGVGAAHRQHAGWRDWFDTK